MIGWMTNRVECWRQRGPSQKVQRRRDDAKRSVGEQGTAESTETAVRSIGRQIQDPQPVRGSEMEEVLSQFTSACGQRLSVQPEVSELAKRILENCGEIIETTLTSPSQARFLSCVC